MMLAVLATFVPPIGTGLINTLVTLVVIGVILYLVETFIPLSPPIKAVLRVVAVLVAVIYLLRLIGVGV